MAYAVPTGVPTRFAAGTTLSFKIREHQQFPVSESWVYKLHLNGRTSKTIQAVASNGEYSFALAAADNALEAGNYRWVIRATKAAETYPVPGFEGTLSVLANSAVADATDSRSWAEKMLAAVETLLLGNGTIPDAKEYEIHGRRLVKMDRPELMRMRNQLSIEVSRQRNGGRLPPIEIGFKRA